MSTMVEMKARIEDLNATRELLLKLNALQKEVIDQKDTYFDVTSGRLKLREINGSEKAQIFFYERPNIAGVKMNRSISLEVEPSTSAKKMLEKLFKVKVVVKKTREIYSIEKCKVHLDRVVGLGTFLELEMQSLEDELSIRKSRGILNEILEKLNVPTSSMESLSYSDLLIQLNQNYTTKM